jgi:hypothetical protein
MWRRSNVGQAETPALPSCAVLRQNPVIARRRKFADNGGSMDWYDATVRYHERTISHECRLSSLPEEWQRELAALWRLEADVNNGAYLQFLSNWGRESFVYASRALKTIGALQMATIVDRCQALVDEHFNSETASRSQMQSLMPNPVIMRNGEVVKPKASILPESVLDRIYELSYEFMDYPEDLGRLGLQHYRPYIEGDSSPWANPSHFK